MKEKLQNKSQSKKTRREEYWASWWRMLPVVLIAGAVPLIVRLVSRKTYMEDYPWYSTNETVYEFFLASKMIAMTVLLVAMILLLAAKLWEEKKIPFRKIFIPLGVYLGFIFLSTVFSENADISLSGGVEMYESFWVLTAYCLSVYYLFLNARTETDLRVVVDAICFSASIIGIIGTLQGIGIDIFNFPFVHKLVTSELDLQRLGGKLEITMGKGVAYATLYNPNYLGVYGSFLLPFLAMLVLFEKSLWRRFWDMGTFVLVAIAMLSSRSRAGLLAAGIALFVALLICFRPILKWWYLTIPAMNFIVVILLLVNTYNENIIFSRLTAAFQKTPPAEIQEEVVDGVLVKKSGLTQLYTTKDGVVFEYNQVKARIVIKISEKNGEYYMFDENNVPIELIMSPQGDKMRIDHPALRDIEIKPGVLDDVIDGRRVDCFGFEFIVGEKWTFIYIESKDEYKYVTPFGKDSDMIQAEAYGFEDRQTLFSGRGFIWSRTIPLLKKHIFIGSGPDTFVLEFPHTDYLAMYKHGYKNSLMTKPHSMYLQIGVQTGVVSLLAFLVFYFWYVIQSIRLYAFRSLKSLEECFGVSAVIGSIGYMISGLTNDSMLVTSPVFWVMVGVGVAANELVKMQRKTKES